MGEEKTFPGKKNVFYATLILVLVVVIRAGMITDQKFEDQLVLSPEGEVLYDPFAQREIQKFNEHFQEVRASMWKEKLVLRLNEPYAELVHLLKARHKLQGRGEVTNLIKGAFLEVVSIEGLESFAGSEDFRRLQLYKKEDHS